MAEDKKGFILYADQKELFDKLPNEKAGELIKHIFMYVNDENPVTDDLVIDISFTPIKQQFKRDLEKWEKTRKGRSLAGKASAAARANKKEQTPTNPTSVEISKQTPTNPTVTVNDNVTVNVNGNVNGNGNVNVKVKDIKDKVYSKEIHETFKNCVRFFPEHLHPKQSNSWLDTIEKLNRIEKIPFDMIESIVKKTRNDDFWSSNFLSLTKLRKKNKDGLMWVIVFNEQIKSNGKTGTTNKGGTANTVSEEYIKRLNDQLQS